MKSRINFQLQPISIQIWRKICENSFKSLLKYDEKSTAVNVAFQAFYIHLFAVIASQKHGNIKHILINSFVSVHFKD